MGYAEGCGLEVVGRLRHQGLHGPTLPRQHCLPPDQGLKVRNYVQNERKRQLG